MAYTKLLDKEQPTDNLSIGLPELEPEILLTPNIGVIGVGGAGGNAINNMIESHLAGATFIVANTDAQSMSKSLTHERIQLGSVLTQGLGAGSNPDIGKKAAEESHDKIKDAIKDLQMLFIAAGMGGGTGTGASPVIARIAKELGILTVGVVTKPFRLEGSKRMRIAESGIEELAKYVDTLIIIPNQNLFRITKADTSFVDAFKMADDVLYQGVRSITDLMMIPMLVNLDFADLTTVIKEMGKAMMGSGEAEGENRAIIAAEKAISNPLLDVSMKGARGILINISGGTDLKLMEVDEAAERVRSEVDENANIIFGASCDETLEGKIRVSVVATGLSNDAMTSSHPQTTTIIQEKKEEVVVIKPATPVNEPAIETTTTTTVSVEVSHQDTGSDDSFVPEAPVIVAPEIPEVTDDEDSPDNKFVPDKTSDENVVPLKHHSFLSDGFLPGIFGEKSSLNGADKKAKRDSLKPPLSEMETPIINEEDIVIPSFLRRKND